MNTATVLVLPTWLVWVVVGFLLVGALQESIKAIHTARLLKLSKMKQRQYEAEFQPSNTAPLDRDIFCLLEDGMVVIGLRRQIDKKFVSPDWHRGVREIQPVGWSPLGGGIKRAILASKLKEAVL